MKKLFAIPRLSLSEAFTILITLVVCLAGFTEAEINSDYKKEDSNPEEEKNFLSKGSSYKESNRHSLETSNAGNDELKQNYFAYLKNLPESPFEKLNEKYLDNFGEPDEFDNEKENDGYSYDDDEYYHFNYKRNDQNRKAEISKLEKTKLEGTERKENTDQNYFAQSSKAAKDIDGNNEIKTIEMLNFKEYHPNTGADTPQNSIQNQNQFSKDLGHKKIFSQNRLDTLNVVNLKENSAIDETLKDRKNEKSSVLDSVPSDSKITEVKKSVKTTDEKESAKLKDPKASEESVKKDKEESLKEGKEVVSAKKLKDSSKTSEEKEKTVKLSESAKLEENIEKISNNNKEGDAAKLAKDDKDVSRFSNKISSDVINPKEISQINNRANYVANEYKESFDNMKIPESQINEKNSDEMSETEKNVDSNNFLQSFTEKQYNLKSNEKNDNYEELNEHNDLAKVLQDQEKSSYFSPSINYEFPQDKSSELYKKRESWKPGNNMPMKSPQQPILLSDQTLHHDLSSSQQPQQPMIDLSYDALQKQNLFQNMDNNLPTNELESTDYYKNYLKSLRKYKNQNDNSRNINIDLPPSGYNLIRKMAFRDQTENKKKKRSKPKKRKLLLSEEMSQEKEKEQEQIGSSNLGKNNYKTQNTLSSQSEKSAVPTVDSQLSSTKASKEDNKLAEDQKREQQSENNRLRRKSPLKLEYEIKVINQSPQDQKNVQFSRFSPMRLRKDVKTKLDDKYLKKYPYSQVNRDDLTGLNSEPKNAKKYKRKAPVRKRYSQKSIRTRAAPSGYYSNRVKFGQKSLTRNNEKTNSDSNIPLDVNKMSSSNFNSESSNIDKNYPSVWETKQPSFNSDEDTYLKEDNSLFLVKKGERTAKAFEEGSSKPSLSDELDPEQLAKILSKANDYVVLKKTDHKFRKISDYEPSSFTPSDFVSFPLYDKKSPFIDQFSPYNLANNERPVPYNSKNLRTRSSNPRKDDKKYFATFRSSTSKSNLKKTLDKFKDLADFFKDNEQESTDNQYSAQEAIEGRDIVFSEDKLPDPIVISNDGSEKLDTMNQKPQNSIYSISTNFKNIDTSSKKNDAPNNNEENKDMFTAGVKSDNVEMSYNPALKSLFPEASSINSINKNGNEIIVLDFNHNQLKPQQGFRVPQKISQPQSYGTFNPNNPTPSMNHLNILGSRKVKFILESPLSSKTEVKNENENSKNQLKSEQNKNYALTSNGEKQPTMSNSFDYNKFPNLLKNLIKKNAMAGSTKTVRKINKEEPIEKSGSEYYKQFRTIVGNKNSYINEHYNNPSEERNVIKVNLPSSSFSELSSYSGVSVKQLGNLLQNIMPKDYSTYTGNDYKSNVETYKNSKELQNLDNSYQDAMKYGLDYGLSRPSQWFSNEENKDDGMDNISKEVKDEMNKIFSNQDMSNVKENNYAQIRKQIENVSDEIRRLRREEMEKRNLAQKNEQTMTVNKEYKTLDAKFQQEDTKTSPDFMNPNDLNENEGNNDKNSEYKTLKRVDEPEESPEKEESLDYDYDSHLSELFENLSKNSKNPSESARQRQKRFSRHDLEDKVSKTEVQNTILKNLPEDNYQSVYSPGIKRRLLSIENEADNADADELDKNTEKESQENCVRNAANNCVDPVILELFGGDGYEEEKIRGRRSLSHFHTNFKREIDLDESMPNDFQNFLVTSLGGVGSEKREVVKKDEALWGGKESSQDNYNQIVESWKGKETNEDSALEKREVSSSENCKTQGLTKSDYYSARSEPDSNFADMMNSFKQAEKKIRSDSKSKLRSKSSEFVDEKLPTQIRIQITNGSSKEKKSSKPIMDESETSSTDVENVPKEKEFFDKNKINPLIPNRLPKFHQAPKNKFSYGEFKEDESKHLGDKQKAYHSYQRRKRKKKKFVTENPMKPVNDFITFDQKAVESLLKRYKPSQNMMPDQTTQKIPVSHPLPQVETVYNPTQDTNKAQLEMTRLGKINSITNKNAESAKNSLRLSDASTYDDGIIRSYLKLDKMKSNEEGLKEFEDVEWKPYSRKMGFRQRQRPEGHYEVIHPTQEAHVGSSPTFSSNLDSPALNSYHTNTNMYGQMAHQNPYNRFFYHSSPQNMMNNQVMYDVLKLKQQMKNQNAMNLMGNGNKPDSRPYYFYDGGYKQEDKDKTQNLMTPYLNPNDKSWNYFDYYYNKNPYSQSYRMKDYYPYMTKTTNQVEQKTKNPYSTGKKFWKNLSFDKLLNLDNQSPVLDNYRDIDYLDATDDYYLDEYPSKESHLDELLDKDVLKKAHLNKFEEPQNYYQNKIPEVDDGLNEEDDELEEDYEENSDEEDLDDYSLLTNSNLDDPQLTKNFHGTEKLQNYQSQSDIFANRKYYNPEFEGSGTDVSKFISSFDDKLNLGVADIDFKTNLGQVPKSTVLLQKANQNSRVFAKNALNNIKLNDLRKNGAWRNMNDKTSDDWQSMIRNDLKKTKFRRDKLKRSQRYPMIGSRLFYAAKTEINDVKDLNPMANILKSKDSKNKRRSLTKTPLADSFHAQFASLEDGFDNGSEQNEKHIGENLMISEKTQKERSPDDNDDMEENLENDGDAIAQDNYLENIIGKYIMRKAIKPTKDLEKASTKSDVKCDSDNSIEHKIKKRSTQKLTEKEPKVLKKRLSSGHLTENNFRKYHKKNFSRKRNIKDSDTKAYELTTLIKDDKQGENVIKNKRQAENEKQKKRSALDLFKKITNKDRENKKAENSDGRTAGFEPLLSLTDKKFDKNSPFVPVKKSASDSLQADLKGNPPELKAHYPNEGQRLRAQLNEKKGDKSKEALKDYPTSSAQGPWKIDLNDKYESKAAEHPDKDHRKSFKSPKILDTKLSKGDDDNLKAFLVISKSPRRIKRGTANGLCPVSGSSIGQPQSGEGKGIFKKQVQKTSLASTKSKTHGDQILESQLNEEERSRALHCTKNLFEPRPFKEPKGNIKKNENFVTANEQCKNSGFLSKGRLTKSVFSPMRDENIIRNSRNINEETSEYLGQQIVDAILFHVNANPKFKQLIAPGLTMRTTTFNEDTEYNKKRALHQVEFSEQLQAFFKKFMSDLEKMTEQHVKKRMCHEIDKQSKHFLQSLLIAPINNVKEEDKTETKEDKFPTKELYLEVKRHQNPGFLPFMITAFARPQRVNLKQTDEKPLEAQQYAFEEPPPKPEFLQTLKNNHHIPSYLQKDILDNTYGPLSIDPISRPTDIPDYKTFRIPISEFLETTTCPNQETNDKPCPSKNGRTTIKLKMFKKPDQNNDTTINCSCEENKDQNCENQPPSDDPECSSNNANTETLDNNNNKSESVYYFTEVESPYKLKDSEATTPLSPFETVDSANETVTQPNENKKEDNATKEPKSPDFKDGMLIAPNSQRFGSLSSDSSTIQDNMICNKEFLAKKRIEKFNIEDYLLPPYDKPIELRKPSSGNGGEHQSSLKHQNLRMRNLNAAKTLKNAPKISEKKAVDKANQPSQKNTDRRILRESRNPRSLIVPDNTNSAQPNSLIQKNSDGKTKSFYTRPIFSSKIDKKFNTPKIRPFEKAAQSKWPSKKHSGPFEYFLRRDSPPNSVMYGKHRHGKQFLIKCLINLFLVSPIENEKSSKKLIPLRSLFLIALYLLLWHEFYL